MSHISRRKNPDGSIRYKCERNNWGQYFNGMPLPHVSTNYNFKTKQRLPQGSDHPDSLSGVKFRWFVWASKIRMAFKRFYCKLRGKLR